MSLHEAALTYQSDHIEEHQELEAPLRKIRGHEEVTKLGLQQLSFKIKALYRGFLANFGGIICATPIAAGEFQFRTKFRPEIATGAIGSRPQGQV